MSTATLAYQELPPMASWSTDNQAPYHHDPNVMIHFTEVHHQFDNNVHPWQTFTNDASMRNNGPLPVEPTSPGGHWSPHSPMAGVNGGQPPAYDYARNSIYSNDLRAKKRLASVRSGSSSSVPEELCLVCGDKASGYHYNALTCEGCKGFFRRSITRKAMYYCKYGGHCDIDMYMRRKCQACRLRKCLEIGMRPELVIPEEQCRLKRESKIKMRSSNSSGNDERKSNSPQQVTSTENLSPNPSVVCGLLPEQRELIHRILMYQEQYDMPTDEDLTKLSTFGQNESSSQNQHFQHLAELTILTVQLIVEFTKHLPGFLTLNKDDQLILLKACSTEILMLKTAKRYDPKTDTIVLGNQSTSWSYSREAYKLAGMGTATDAIFEFAKSMAKMRVDAVEYALLTAISIFSDRPGLVEPRKVEDIQEVYTSTLQAYIDVHRPKNRTVFARLLMKLTDLRTLGSEHADMLFALKLQETNNAGGDHMISDETSSSTNGEHSNNNKTANHKTSTNSKRQTANNKQNHHIAQQCGGGGGGGPVSETIVANGNEVPGGHVSTPSSGYRVPNVRIKVEPLSGGLLTTGQPMNGDLHSPHYVDSQQQHFTQLLPIHQQQQPEHHNSNDLSSQQQQQPTSSSSSSSSSSSLSSSSCTFMEYTKLNNLYFEPHQ